MDLVCHAGFHWGRVIIECRVYVVEIPCTKDWFDNLLQDAQGKHGPGRGGGGGGGGGEASDKNTEKQTKRTENTIKNRKPNKHTENLIKNTEVHKITQKSNKLHQQLTNSTKRI